MSASNCIKRSYEFRVNLLPHDTVRNVVAEAASKTDIVWSVIADKVQE